MIEVSKSQITEVLDKVLEWFRFIELSQREARSELAKSFLEDLKSPDHWAVDLSAARHMQQETLEMTTLLDRDALWGTLLDLSDPLPVLDRLSKGSILELSDLCLLRRWLYAIDSWAQTPREEIRAEKFKKALSRLFDPYKLLRVLDQLLTPEGELSEKASPKLASLYSEIRSIKREIGNVLDHLMKSLSQRGIVQENFTDVRDGRYVLPIKIASQNEVEGIIYEASASRQTVFVEPKEVSLLNNRLRQKQNELLQEIDRILEALSGELTPYLVDIQSAVLVLAYWDAIQAKARFGRHYSGKSIQVTEERCFQLHQTAHPLLWWSMPAESIVRNAIDFGTPVRALLLTGPNTGGKTVLLKTLGMAGICARTGFLFPGIDLPTVPFFTSFFADLGDSQSIEQHLSSFSGHVFKFKKILEQMTDHSLVLIDELNSATDPEEGAALGRAFLETVISKNAMVITTTHDPHLKILAASDSRILNASMAFDETSELPTYRIQIGVPGRSRALETAARLGLPAEVIQLAKSYLSQEHNEFERVLSKFESESQSAARARREAVSLREEAEKLKKEWMERTQISVSDLLDKTRQKLRRMLEQAQDEVRSSVRKLDEVKNRKEIDTTRAKLNQTFSEAVTKLDSALKEEAPELARLLPKKQEFREEPRAATRFLQKGATVRVPKWKSLGTLLEVSGDKVKVALGGLQMTLSAQDVELVAPPSTKAPTVHAKLSEESSSMANSKIDLRGMRLEEALQSLGQYLDEVFLQGNYVEVTVVHGLGTGALREGTLRMLRNLPYIKAFRDGGQGQGGAGATLVEFDRD